MTFTIDDASAGDEISAALLERHTIACAKRLGPIVSAYRWNGVREVTNEWLVVLTTTAEAAPEVIDLVVAGHPYELPEVIVTPIDAGHPAYLSWIADAVGASS